MTALSEGVGRYATSRVPTGLPEDSVTQTRAAIAGTEFASAAAVVVLHDEEPVGLIPIEALLAAPDSTTLSELVDGAPPTTTVEVDRELVASRLAVTGVPGVILVDEAGRFQGLIPATTMLPVLLAEHDEDVARIGGYLASTERSRLAIEEPLGRRLWHRMPWLLVGLAGAMLSAIIVGAFEAELDANVLLAFFVPAVVYMAGAVGSQTVTVLVRGIAIGVKPETVFGRELLTGLVAGVIVGLAFFPFSLLAWGDEEVALAVALSLAATCFISTVVAMLLPWGLQKVGADPAFGSGPISTIIQDLASITVYLVIATAIVS